MNKRLMLCIEVDTNDGDYEEKCLEITAENSVEVEKFLKYLDYLPVKENYHYNGNGDKIVTGNIIEFPDRVGYCLDFGECALKSMVLPEDEFISEGWTEEEMRQDGMITPYEYKVLTKFLPMYVNEGFGFHSIISVTIQEHIDPVIVSTKTFKLTS